MIIRVEAPNGNRRYNLKDGDLIDLLIKKVNEDLKGNYTLFHERTRIHKIRTGNSLKQLKLKHGDKVYAWPSNNLMDVQSNNDIVFNTKPDIIGKKLNEEKLKKKENISNGQIIVQASIDDKLDDMSGRVERGKTNLCSHHINQKCIHCLPLEPFDEEYLRDICVQPVKHMPFHSYLKQLKATNNEKMVTLHHLWCKMKTDCEGHRPWPLGTCTKCQPPSITLHRQEYRHVDNIMISNKKIMESFIESVHTEGGQRMGIMFGKYVPYNAVSLGIQAQVEAIYEPAQIGSNCKINLNLKNWKKENNDFISLAKEMGWEPVGWIFTDLIPDSSKPSQFLTCRGNWQYILSGEETMMASHFQSIFPNICKYSEDNYFGSKFVTVLVTANEENTIDFYAFQVSNQGVDLYNANILLPTRDAPELVYIRDSSDEQFVPDVFFMQKDQYGNKTRELARPFPIEYLIVQITFGVAAQETNVLTRTFPVENRRKEPSFRDVSNYLKNKPIEEWDIHFLHYMLSQDIFSLTLDKLKDLFIAYINNDARLMDNFSTSLDWLTVVSLCESLVDTETKDPLGELMEPSELPEWNCDRCTYLNRDLDGMCQMCSGPRPPPIMEDMD
ncbi:hypothetical protein SNEBB_003380 [Seison nebaliae]|nr:hypothetical protein SNEBB_003380 [Seison nebaliae]